MMDALKTFLAAVACGSLCVRYLPMPAAPLPDFIAACFGFAVVYVVKWTSEGLALTDDDCANDLKGEWEGY